jgi:inosose dehydratase
MTGKERRLLAGHTGITWMDDHAEAGIKCIAVLGYHNIEIFAWVLEKFYDGGRKDIFQQYGIPLVSSYYSVDIVNPGMREAEMRKLSRWTDIVAELGGKYATLGGNTIDRRVFRFEEHKSYIIDFVNEAAKILENKGVCLCFHPHTSTPVESQVEIASFFDSADTRYVGFAPDIGQIQKGGAEPIGLIKDYISILRLVHLKDYSGRVEFDSSGKEIDTTGFACYCPLGEGAVDLAGILEYLEESPFAGPVMAELDGTASMPVPAEEAVLTNKKYLQRLGYSFLR